MIGKILNSKVVKKFKRFLGKNLGLHIKIKRFTPSASEELRTATIVKSFDIDTVIDIGANKGQFAESLIDYGYDKKIISFEPVSSNYDKLLSRSKKNDNWIVAEKCAIGDTNGSTTINITKDTVFSSILPIEKWHSKLKPKSEIINTEEIAIHKLDSIIDKYLDPNQKSKILLKIDTQGYEKQVLEGSKELLKKISGIKIEIPLVPIYNGVELGFYETLDFLKENGFQPYSFNCEGVNLKTGRVNTIDGLFFRDN